MRYQQPELQEHLAAEYVLGTLHGRARKRFERLLADDPGLAERVQAWQARLEPLDAEQQPVTPPARVWENIAARVGAGSPRRWRRLGLMATAAALLLALTSTFLYRQLQRPEHLLMVTDERARPVWVVRAVDRRRLKVRTLRSMNMPAKKVCVLWLEWPDGHVRPVGVLSEEPGEHTMALPRTHTHDPLQARVTVSIEDGPAPPPTPRGKIVFRGRWIEL